MKTYKRLVALILIIVMVMSFIGCESSGLRKDNTGIGPAVNAAAAIAQTDTKWANTANGSVSENLPTKTLQDEDVEIPTEEEERTGRDSLTETQRNSINMLNYMSVLTQRVNDQKGNQLFLESAYNSFDNLYPNAVDTKTQVQIMSLMDTIYNYRMIDKKRERLQFIYEQNLAQAMRQAIPNPIGLLSAIQSGSILKTAASVLYMAIDSASSYKAATSQADLQFIQAGWELDDAESKELHNSTKNALSYLLNMVRDYDLPGDLALTPEAIRNFVLWSDKPESQRTRAIIWFESHQETYSDFGPYWLELAKKYYAAGRYEDCIDSVKHYETIATRIFRKDLDYVNVLPMVIVSAKETMNQKDYVKTAEEYCSVILKNIGDADWTLRYFTAQIYLDLYALTKDNSYMEKAYTEVQKNVVVLVDKQRELNQTYIADVKDKEASAGKDATKRKKEEIKNYNNAIKEEQKIALPPVCEALYLNCDLLFALAKERNIPLSEQKEIDAVLHENEENLFLTEALDNRFWFEKREELHADEIEVEFDEDTLVLPANCVTDRSFITVTITSTSGTTTLDDWIVNNVKRPQNSEASEFQVVFKSEAGDDYKYQVGDVVTIKVIPVEESPDVYLVFKFDVIRKKYIGFIPGKEFRRVTE